MTLRFPARRAHRATPLLGTGIAGAAPWGTAQEILGQKKLGTIDNVDHSQVVKQRFLTKNRIAPMLRIQGNPLRNQGNARPNKTKWLRAQDYCQAQCSD